MKQIEKTLTSLEVAEMVGKKHSEMLKDIRRYEGQLNEVKIPCVDFFDKSMYADQKGDFIEYMNVENYKTVPCMV